MEAFFISLFETHGLIVCVAAFAIGKIQVKTQIHQCIFAFYAV
jgi:hypothetical protein